MNVRLLTLSLCVLLLGVIAPVNYLFAVSESTITIATTPENPGPGENVTVHVHSYVSNLDAVSITWYVNGKKANSGIGQKSTSFVMPTSGGNTTVRATIALPDGATERQIIIRPSTMVLLYEATDAYVPPFYRGKALPVTGSSIKVVALPEIKGTGGFVNPKSIIYEWQQNYTNDVEASGYSKNSFIFVNDYLEDADVIGVRASTADGQESLSGNITINPSAPVISFYSYSKDFGVLWEKALKNSHRVNGEEIVVAEPYFMTPKEIKTPRLIWNWFINDKLIYIADNHQKNTIPLTVESGASGTSKLKLEIENRDDILNSVQKEISVEF